MLGDSAYNSVLSRLVKIYLLENRECKSVVLARLVPMSSLDSLRNAQLSLPSNANNSISALATIGEDVSSISIIAMFITPECTIYILASSFQDGGMLEREAHRSDCFKYKFA